MRTSDCLKIRKRRPIKIEIEHFMYSAFHDLTKSRNMKFQDFVRLSERSVQKMFYFYFYLVLCFKFNSQTVWRQIAREFEKDIRKIGKIAKEVRSGAHSAPLSLINYDIRKIIF